jgi:hypothetical protein
MLFRKKVAKLIRYYQFDQKFRDLLSGCFDEQQFYPCAYELIFNYYSDLNLEEIELEDFLHGLNGKNRYCPCNICQSCNAFNQAGLNFSSKKK